MVAKHRKRLKLSEKQTKKGKKKGQNYLENAKKFSIFAIRKLRLS